MAIGDKADMVSRLRSVLPGGWFPPAANPGDASLTPILDGVLNGIGAACSWLFSLYAYANLQTRIASATDIFLDITAFDYLGNRIVRSPGQLDAAFSAQIRKEIIRPRGTRAALVQSLTDLTGRAPIVFEPAHPPDTGGIGYLGMTVGTGLAIAGSGASGAGGYGSLALSFQVFLTAYRAHVGGIPGVAGYYTGSGWAGGGIGSIIDPSAAGAIEVADLSMSQGQITDADIQNAVVSVMPAATLAWMNITN